MGMLVVAIDWSIVNNALPSIQRDLGASFSELQWIVNAFGLAMAMMMVIMGRLADAFGRKKVFMIGLLICLFSSIGAALSPTVYWLITFRAFQGISNAIAITTSQSLMTHVFPEEKHGKAIGIWSTLIGVGLAMGPVIGGIIIAIASWHWIFYFNIPFLIISWILVRIFVEESKNEEQNAKIDVPGFILFALGLGSLVMGVIQGPEWGWDSKWTLGLFGLSIIFLTSFYFVEKRVSSPLIHFEFFKKKSFFASCIGNISIVFLFWGIFFSVPLYLQNVLGKSSFESGMFMLAVSIPFIFSSHYAGPLGDKIDKKILLLGGIFLAMIGVAMMSFFTTADQMPLILIALFLFGVGTGGSFAPSTSLGLSVIPRNFVGVASGVLTTAQEIGGNLGLALVGAVLSTMEKSRLTFELQNEGVTLTPSMVKKVRSLISSFDQFQAYLSHLSDSLHHLIMQAFKASFVYGFQGAMWMGVGVAALGLVSIFFLTRKVR